VCLIAFVVTVQLIHSPNSELQKYLRSDEAGVIRQTRNMCSVKFSHTHFVTRRLTEIFLVDPLWCNFLDRYFAENTDILQDSVQANDALMIQFASLVYTNALNRIRDNHSAKDVWWVVGNKVFRNILQCLGLSVRDKHFNASATLARIFALLCEKCSLLNLIDRVEADSMDDTGDPHRVRISYSTMFGIIDLVHTQLIRERSSAALTTRSYIISSIKMLCRNPGVFSLVRAELPQKVLTWCKDGHHYQSNKNAWRVFYCMISYHTGMLEEMIDKKILSSFTDLLAINNGSNAITINSIHYIGKLFTMYANENRRIQYYRPPKREDLKTVERDVKTFCQFFRDRTCFIKLHMIYTSRSSTQLGAAFLEIAKLYYALATLPECEKLFTVICKDANYKVGVMNIKAMYTSS